VEKLTADHFLETGEYEKKHPELKGEERFTSPASSLPLHELKMLKEYIHGVNLQNLGKTLPHRKKQMMLLKFFKHKKNQRVEVYSRNKEEVIHTIAKVQSIGRDFVMLTTLFTRIWIPYHAIHSAKTPFGIPDLPNGHQHITYDQELRRKLLTNFGEIVSGKETLKQQFYEESLETNLKSWCGVRLTLQSNSLSGKVKLITSSKGKLRVKANSEKEVPLNEVSYIKQNRFTSFLMEGILKLFRGK